MRTDTDITGHFFASNFAEWKVGTDLPQLLKDITKSSRHLGAPFNLFYVPLDSAAQYKIHNYQPVVDGLIFMGTYK